MTACTFPTQLVTRSMCIEHVGLGVPECPNYGAVFVRDIVSRFNTGPLAIRHLRLANKGKAKVVVNESNANKLLKVARGKQCLWEKTRPLLSASSPCRELSAEQCHHFYVAALK